MANKRKKHIVNDQRCNIQPYGDEERICKECGYVLWEEKGKKDEEIIKNMIEFGYPTPECLKKYK